MAEFDGHYSYEHIPPFQEAVDWYLEKKIVTREVFETLSREARTKAFTAARVYAADELLNVYKALELAIEKGSTYQEFRAMIGELMPRPWHRETVFRTNVLSAYGAGHHQRAQETRHLRPYGRYSAVMDGRTRPSHARLHGLVYPLDHQFWQRYWPPWGYNCRCGVRTLSQMEVAEEGLAVQDEMTGLPEPEKKFASPAGAKWEPDIAKYPPALKYLVADQIALAGQPRPLSVSTREEMAAVIKDKLSDMARHNLNVVFTNDDYVMATDSNGTLFISSKCWAAANNICGADDLLSAMKKLGRESLSFNEEYALESLWHEINHNRQIISRNYPNDHYKTVCMETVTQWLSRRTYQRMMQQLGGFAPEHQAAIISDGYGYGQYVKRFELMLRKLGVAAHDVLDEIEQIYVNVDRNNYAESIARILATESNKSKAKIRRAMESFNVESRFNAFLANL
ncbi:MAG: phage minor head protein [Candidatus Cloacimonadaceae bacterium]|jgi:SPP1 gp7 family putative phage head morphogenesis protein